MIRNLTWSQLHCLRGLLMIEARKNKVMNWNKLSHQFHKHTILKVWTPRGPFGLPGVSLDWTRGARCYCLPPLFPALQVVGCSTWRVRRRQRGSPVFPDSTIIAHHHNSNRHHHRHNQHFLVTALSNSGLLQLDKGPQCVQLQMSIHYSQNIKGPEKNFTWRDWKR